MVLESLIEGSFGAALILEDETALTPKALSNIDSLIDQLPKGWHMLGLDCPRQCQAAPTIDAFYPASGEV